MALRARSYFQDFRFEKGKSPVYCGDLYVRPVDKKIRDRERWAYAVLAPVAATLLIAAMRRPVNANMGGWTAGVSILALIPAFCVMEGALEAFFRKGDLRRGNYQERLIMLRAMPIAAAVLSLLMTFGYFMGFLDGGQRTDNGIAVFCALAAAIIYAGIAWRETHIRYQVIKGSGAAVPQVETENGEDAGDE